MPFVIFCFLLLCIPSFAVVDSDPRVSPDELQLRSLRSSWKRATTRNVPPMGFYDPLSTGGSMLSQVQGTFPPGQGEPINAIVSGNSDAAVLVDQETSGGFRNYVLSFYFAAECLGQHAGSDQSANLGDGNGYVNQTAVIRYDYGDPELGTCKETIQGGNHFRYWVQDGSQGNSGAVFMAVSYEQPIAQGHNIVPNGYNFGRDWLVGNATNQAIPTLSLTNVSTFSGSTSFGGYTYSTSVTYISGLLQNTSVGINHNQSVPIDGMNAIDGLVALLNVKITAQPGGSKKSSGWRPSPPCWPTPAIIVLLGALLSLPQLL